MSDVQTIMTGWMNAALDGLVDQGLDRTALTAGLRGFEGGRAPRSAPMLASMSRSPLSAIAPRLCRDPAPAAAKER